MSMEEASSELTYIRTRTANACDACKSRKVKCNGELPCSYCSRRRRPQLCHYSPQKRRRLTQQPSPGANRQERGSLSHPSEHGDALDHVTASSTPGPASLHQQSPANHSEVHAPRFFSDPLAEEETEVPREARLLRDAQGKHIFIGDCAPLSFFQTVRQLVTNYVDETAFVQQSGRYSVLENTGPRPITTNTLNPRPPPVAHRAIENAVLTYLSVTAGLVDLFDDGYLSEDIKAWAEGSKVPDDMTATSYYLVLAIGHQRDQEELATAYFEYAREQALSHMNGNLVTVGMIQAFVLITLYMLGACQGNGAFLFFGIAARSAYSIGLHRTEINSRFGGEIHRQRDRLWISLRILDLFLSTTMGRPPATSDIDCTVPYRTVNDNGNDSFDILSASVQIFLVIESIVVEIYSRRKITLQLTEGISRQLRYWSARWLQPLRELAASEPKDMPPASTIGACQVLATYYYAVMLVSRPFLVFEVYRRLSAGSLRSNPSDRPSGKSKLAEACIDSAAMTVDLVLDLVDKGTVKGKTSLLVTWLFASSVTLGLGLVGNFGRFLDKYTRKSIQALKYFAKSDTHAVQYQAIAESLLAAALGNLERSETAERLQRTEFSNQLFGLQPASPQHSTSSRRQKSNAPGLSSNLLRPTTERVVPTTETSHAVSDSLPPDLFSDLDAAFLSLSDPQSKSPGFAFMSTGLESEISESFGDWNLFPLLDAGDQTGLRDSVQ